MSRRPASTMLTRRLAHSLVAILSLSLLLAAALPGVASAQTGKISDVDVEQRWQLLTYLPPNATRPQPVPAGVGATLLLWGGNRASGEAACSTYETTYNRQGSSLFIDSPQPDYVTCDPSSQDFDEVFYRHLADTASIVVDDSILTLKDNIGQTLMVLTRAKIDDDPTVARWNLARIGAADGAVEPVIVGLDPWIEFLRGGSLVGSSACGSFLGSYSTDKGTIDVTDVRYRLRDCTDAALSQAERTIATLAEVTRFEVLPAGLALQDENGITRLALTPELSLGRRTWTPTAIFDAAGRVQVEGNELSTSAVKFDRQVAEGRSICAPFTAESLRSGLALTVDDDSIRFVYKGCPKNDQLDWTGIQRAFMNALRAASSHALRGSELELKDVDGNTLMRLEPQAELVGPTWVVTRLGRKNLRAPVGDTPLTLQFDDIGLASGDTGAAIEGRGSNYFQTFYDLPQATRIDIDKVGLQQDVDGRACRAAGNKRKNTPECKQETTYLQLLSNVDGYIARDNVLQLLQGNRTVMRLEPEQIVAARSGE